MDSLNHIRNFLRIDDRLATSGMPRPDDFAALRQAGFDVVINLALPTSDNALPNEGELVSAQGMTYVYAVVSRRSRGVIERMIAKCSACSASWGMCSQIFTPRAWAWSVPR